MRICHISPKLLDTKGLVALWRETLLAQSAIYKNTRSWKNHAQLRPFKIHKDFSVCEYLSNYLHIIAKEAKNRTYNFDTAKILFTYNNKIPKITTTLEYILQEWKLLTARYKIRSQNFWLYVKNKPIEVHPSFAIQSHARSELVSYYEQDAYFAI